MQARIVSAHLSGPRLPIACAVAFLLQSCASRPPLNGPYAEIDVVSAAACSEPAAVVRELRDARARKVQTRQTPIRVAGGVYSIGISCGSSARVQDEVCLDQSTPAARFDIPAYELVLEPGSRYVFSCARVSDQTTVRLSVSTF
jgi:hypothetical protein